MPADVRLVERDDPEYPVALAHIANPPRALWVRGRRLDELPMCVAVVGSRSPTPYGLQIAEDLAADLAASGMCVVSGLARGCDGAAHQGALRATRGTTVAVLGTGIDVCHPKHHRRLAERIAVRGALVTEYPPGTPGFPSNFVERNRIISGLSKAVVVVQAGRRSGALGTARLALDQGRDVFAVPGNVDVEASFGPHSLLRDGAHVCTGAGDVIAGLDPAGVRSAMKISPGDPREAVVATLPAEQQELYRALSSARPLEVAARRAGLGAADAAVAVVRLEIAGLVVRTLGHLWKRTPQ